MLKLLRAGAFILLPLCLVIGGWLLVKDASIPVLQPSGEVASHQRDLFVFTVALSLLVVLPVYGLLALFVIKYRSTNKKAKYTPDWAENKWLEGLWWGIPIAVIGVLGVVTFQTSHSLDPYKPLAGSDPIEVQVVALRWKWLFLYPEEGIATLNHLPIAVDRPVHFSMTADAPMSAFWIPALGSQVYAMNGMASELNLKATKTGTYTGYTTNINGEGYADMTFATKVLTNAQYSDWVADAADSNKAMNTRMYETLLAPKSVTTQQTYRLANTDLFQTILDEHMGHSPQGHSAHGGAE